MRPIIRENRLKLSLPLVVTVLLVAWTAVVTPFTRPGDDWAVYPAFFLLPVVIGLHVYLVTVLRPKWPLVGYAVVHSLAFFAVWTVCLMLISKEGL